jgi:hercynylcysteine S-oxide lyase
MDFGPYLTVPDALRFRHWLGGESAINGYTHALALRGGARLAELLGTDVMDPTGELTLSMVNVRLPLPDNLTAEQNAQVAEALLERLLREFNCFAAYYLHDGRWWTRLSAQVWNDVRRLTSNL